MEHSKLVKMTVRNLGCIGNDGLEIALDDIVCLVGANNSGKTTVLRAYELAVTQGKLSDDDLNRARGEGKTIVELWVHIPSGVSNISDNWIEVDGELRLVRSRWTWSGPGKPVRDTWEPSKGDYAADGKAAGLDQVFNSRLPKPLRIASLQDPTSEHNDFLSLIVEPVAEAVTAMYEEDGSELAQLMGEFTDRARAPILEANERFEKIREDVNKKFRDVFPSLSVHLKMDIEPPKFDAKKALQAASEFYLREYGEDTRWVQHGTGAQRALFWSMLQVRSRIKADYDVEAQRQKAHEAEVSTLTKQIAKLTKEMSTAKTPTTIESKAVAIAEAEEQLEAVRKAGPKEVSLDEIGLPGHMLLIDEPETALHPSAVRAASGHLYDLADDKGWQVMMATHAPAFINPLRPHTTIVRLERTAQSPATQMYRASDIQFEEDDEENLKALLRFDTDLAEMFFGARPILVEGDTEYGAFQEVMACQPERFPFARRPVLIRARGKDIMRPIIKMLTHFRVPFAVLHDADVFRTKKDAASSAWSGNQRIYIELLAAAMSNVQVAHRVSVPNFEGANGGQWDRKGSKPWGFVKRIRESATLREEVSLLLEALCSGNATKLEPLDDYMSTLQARVIAWGDLHAPGEPSFIPKGISSTGK